MHSLGNKCRQQSGQTFLGCYLAAIVAARCQELADTPRYLCSASGSLSVYAFGGIGAALALALPRCTIVHQFANQPANTTQWCYTAQNRPMVQ